MSEDRQRRTVDHTAEARTRKATKHEMTVMAKMVSGERLQEFGRQQHLERKETSSAKAHVPRNPILDPLARVLGRRTVLESASKQRSGHGCCCGSRSAEASEAEPRAEGGGRRSAMPEVRGGLLSVEVPTPVRLLSVAG